MTYILRLFPVAALLMLAACVTVPAGPSAMALPGTGKNFDQFRADDFECRQFANAQVGGTDANQAAADSGVKSAAVGTVIGAAAGVAIGGGRGAAIGAGSGLAIGGLAGTGAAESSSYNLQRRYDAGYMQCMYAKGHKVPVSGRFVSSQPQPPAPYQPPANYSPPYPPPPPPR